jgi:hypothetical protein
MSEDSSAAPKKKPAFVKWSLVFAIAIVLNLFWTYAVRVAYHEPTYEDFCPRQQVVERIETRERCLEVGGQWNENVPEKYPVPGTTAPDGGAMPVQSGYCNQEFTCQQKFEDANKVYNRNVFIVFTVVGIAALAASVFAGAAEAVALGLSFGGVLSLIIGSVRYWSDMEDILRVVILGVALAALIWTAYKKFKD